MIGQGFKPRTNNNNQSTMKICKMRDPDNMRQEKNLAAPKID